MLSNQHNIQTVMPVRCQCFDKRRYFACRRTVAHQPLRFVNHDQRAIGQKVLKRLLLDLLIGQKLMLQLQIFNAVDEQRALLLFAVFVGKVGIGFVRHQDIDDRSGFARTRHTRL